jgi:L-glyceraldehyde 3-phosphate reductase
MALAWCMRRKEITSVLIGASSPEQIKENVATLENLDFSDEELTRIDSFAKEGNINLWARSSNN